MHFYDSNVFAYLILPLGIFLARIADVSLGTLRIMFVAKGFRRIAPLIGFFEIIIWLLAISRIFQNLDNWVAYIAYAGGFAAGNWLGMIIEERLALGYEMIRVITKTQAEDLVNVLKDQGFGVTALNAQGVEGDVAIVYIIVKRSMVKKVLELIMTYNPRALYTIEAIKFVNKEIFHELVTQPPLRKSVFHRQVRNK
ncbi:MAG TPA: DUF2179 domain-containing protein [Bacteroidales bacterium]|nr:DUF2179 domain-containing protein [Bacteroidales bacterium]